MAWNCPLSAQVQCLPCLQKGEQRCLNILLKQGFAALCPCRGCYLVYCHDCYLKVLTREKAWVFTLFQLLFPCWKANKRLIVYFSTGTYLRLVSGNMNRRLIVSIQSEAHFLPCETQTAGPFRAAAVAPWDQTLPLTGPWEPLGRGRDSDSSPSSAAPPSEITAASIPRGRGKHELCSLQIQFSHESHSTFQDNSCQGFLHHF